MALVTPLLLFMIVGMIATGVAFHNRGLLQHAAFESAIAGAQSTAGCSVVPPRASQILGFSPHEVDCSVTGQLITVRLAHGYSTILPLIPGRVEVVGRAILRQEADAEEEEVADDTGAE